jgi:hypothetical protein
MVTWLPQDSMPGNQFAMHLAVSLCACLIGGGGIAVLPPAPLAALAVMLVVDAGYQVAFR